MSEITKITSQNNSYSIMVDGELGATASSSLSSDGTGSFNVSFSNPKVLYKDEQSQAGLIELLINVIAEGNKKYQEQL